MRREQDTWRDNDMNIFHPAKVLETFSPNETGIVSADAETQVTVEMWDENIFTFPVNPQLATKIKKDDVVLVDYRPTNPKYQTLKTTIIKILPKEKGSNLWSIYKKHIEKRKKEASQQQQQPPSINQTPSYLG